MNHHTELVEYFRGRAATYDVVEEQPYWRLSHRLLWHVLTKDILSRLPQQFSFLDAGGGTGLWSERFLKSYPASTGVLFDLSPDMLAQASTKLSPDYADRLEFVQGSLEQVDAVLDGRAFDLIVSFHNVIGWVSTPSNVVDRLVRVLASGGFLVLFAPNLFHLAYFNILLGRLDEAERAVHSRKGRFTMEMPPIHAFTPSQLRDMYQHAGLEVDLVTGFPALIYPGWEETQPGGPSRQVGESLSDDDHFEKVAALELAVLREPDIASRGNNILIVGKKVS